jgi:hypothetical protein
LCGLVDDPPPFQKSTIAPYKHLNATGIVAPHDKKFRVQLTEAFAPQRDRQPVRLENKFCYAKYNFAICMII